MTVTAENLEVRFQHKTILKNIGVYILYIKNSTSYFQSLFLFWSLPDTETEKDPEFTSWLMVVNYQNGWLFEYWIDI